MKKHNLVNVMKHTIHCTPGPDFRIHVYQSEWLHYLVHFTDKLGQNLDTYDAVFY